MKNISNKHNQALPPEKKLVQFNKHNQAFPPEKKLNATIFVSLY